MKFINRMKPTFFILWPFLALYAVFLANKTVIPATAVIVVLLLLLPLIVKRMNPFFVMWRLPWSRRCVISQETDRKARRKWSTGDGCCQQIRARLFHSLMRLPDELPSEQLYCCRTHERIKRGLQRQERLGKIEIRKVQPYGEGSLIPMLRQICRRKCRRCPERRVSCNWYRQCSETTPFYYIEFYKK